MNYFAGTVLFVHHFACLFYYDFGSRVVVELVSGYKTKQNMSRSVFISANGANQNLSCQKIIVWGCDEYLDRCY